MAKPTTNANNPHGKSKMAPAKKPEEQRERTFQAVILTDSFEDRFVPFTSEKPRCLLPVANVPLIEYSLDFCDFNGIYDLIIYCSPRTAQVEEYINNSKYAQASDKNSFRSVTFIHSQSASYGDAMRMLDNRGIITGDFLVMYGDTISNWTLGPALDRHRERRTKDKNAIMTVITRFEGSGCNKAIEPFWVVTDDQRIHYYDEMSIFDGGVDLLQPVDNARLPISNWRTDLVDTGMDICTPDVLALWTESFDAEKPRIQFLHNTLKDYELNGKLIYLEEVKHGYINRLSTMIKYDQVSKAIRDRYVLPYHPESNRAEGQKYKRSGKFLKEDHVVLGQTSQIGPRCIIGRGTSIGDGTTIDSSFIGRRCQIGKNVKLINAYIWDDVVIKDGATVFASIVANEAVVGKNSMVDIGSLVSFGVRIGDNRHLLQHTRLSKAPRPNAYDGALVRVPSDPDAVGEDGEGYLYEDDEEDINDPCRDLLNKFLYRTDHLNIPDDACSEDGDSIRRDADAIRSRLSSSTSMEDDSGDEFGSNNNFHKDAVADVFKTLSEAGDFGNTRVEFTSLRLSNNATDEQMRRAIAVAFTKRIAQLLESAVDVKSAVAQTLALPGAKAFVVDVAIGRDNSVEAQFDFLVCLQKDLTHREKGDVVLFTLCQKLYELDVIEEEGFMAWWDSAKSTETDELKAVRKTAGTFIEWLKNADEEESDDDDEDSGEESD